MNKQERQHLRALVRTLYDYQDMRIRTDNRLRKCADGRFMDERNMDDAEYIEDEYDVIEATSEHCSDMETKLKKELEKIVKAHPMWEAFFKNVKGCGPGMAAVIMAEIDIELATTISRIWQYAGLNAGEVEGKKIDDISKDEFDDPRNGDVYLRKFVNKKKEHKAIIKSGQMIRGDKLQQGFLSPYNAWLRTKLCGVLASSMMKHHTKPAKSASELNYVISHYKPYKTRLENSSKPVQHGFEKIDGKKVPKMVPWKDVSPGHRHNAAIRYMIKFFLYDMYVAWRQCEGLPVRELYAKEYLGHVHHANNEQMQVNPLD